jgi:hypothetical protein
MHPAKPGLYRDAIETALRAHTKLPLRSENQRHYQDLFVDINQLPFLDTPDWQVVFGRRGTGKTFLFKLLEEEGEGNVRRDGVLAIYVSAQDCRTSPTGRSVEDKTYALGYFQTFIDLVVTRLTDHVEALLGKPAFLEAFTGSQRRRREEIEDLLLELLTLAQVGAPIAAYETVTRSYRDSTSEMRGSDAGASVDVGIGKKGVSGRARASASRRFESGSTADRSVAHEGPAVPRYALVRDRLVRLVEKLHLGRIDVLLDEWSVLDPTAATAIQPEFADLLKRTLAGDRRLSVKIATNRYQTRFSNRGSGGSYRGLELDADVFEATNLDRALLDQDDLVWFYEELLYKRLVYQHRALEVFDPDGSGHPDEQFILSIFRNRKAFVELVKGAQGIPRDFILLFNSLAQHAGYSVNPLWRASVIRDRIRDKSVGGQAEIEYHSEASQLLSPCIRDVVAQTNSRTFLMRRGDVQLRGSAVDELLEKRLIHEYPRSELPGDVRAAYSGYVLDYGIWLDWARTLQHDPSATDEIPRISHENAASYTIDTRPITGTDRLTCSCGHVFEPSARSYQVRRLCPECFTPVGDLSEASRPTTRRQS